jgi:hypothetical protein
MHGPLNVKLNVQLILCQIRVHHIHNNNLFTYQPENDTAVHNVIVIEIYR